MLLGDSEGGDVFGFVFIIISITLYQEQKTERAFEALVPSPARAPCHPRRKQSACATPKSYA